MIEAGRLIKERLGTEDMAKSARIKADVVRKSGRNRHYRTSNLTDGQYDTYWSTDDGIRSATIELVWKRSQVVRYVDIMEYIPKGQRIRQFHVEVTEDGRNWKNAAEEIQTTTVGYRRIVPLVGNTGSYPEGLKVRGLRLVIDDSKACPVVCKLAVY